MNRRLPRNRSARRGTTIIFVLAVLAIVGGLCHSLAQIAVRRHRQFEHDALQAQVRWLAESAAWRAVIQQRVSPEWSGETWTPDCSNTAVPAGRTADIQIARTKAPAGGDGLHFQIEADLRNAAGDDRRVVTSIVLFASPATNSNASPPGDQK